MGTQLNRKGGGSIGVRFPGLILHQELLQMEMDTAYANLFGTHGEAAVLACDELGLLPCDLLYKPKSAFEETKRDSISTLLVRYTLTERTRQNNMRKVLSIKNRFIAEGDIPQKWKERCRLFPDAPGVPKIPKAIMEKVIEEVDTESDGNDLIDEFGLVKPLPQFGVPCSTEPQADTLTGAGVISEEPRFLNIPSSNPPRSRASTADGLSPVAPKESNFSSDANARPISRRNNQQRRRQPFRRKEILQFLSKNNHVDNTSFCSTGDQEMSVQCQMPPPDPPFLPPLAYPQRSIPTLKTEVMELDEYRQFMLRFAHESTLMAQEYNQFVRHMESRKEANKGGEVTSSFTTDAQLTENHADSDISPKGVKKNDPNALTTSGKTSHERQIDAYVRMAKIEVQRNSSNYKKWNGFLEEMDSYEPIGTIAADLRARINIGICPTFEDYVQSVKEMARRQDKALRQERRAHKELLKIYKRKERNTKQNLEKLKEEQNDIAAEARNFQLEITKQNRKREGRRCNMKQQRTQAKLLKKVERANECHKSRDIAAKDKRYQHDQEEVFRRNLKEKLNAMDMRKKWDVNLVSAH